MAGYSGTTLAKKLGHKANQRVAFLDSPPPFCAALEPPLAEVTAATDPRGRASFDLVVLFAADMAALQSRFGVIAARLTTRGALWAAWPKKASGVVAHLNEIAVRDTGLEAGLGRCEGLRQRRDLVRAAVRVPSQGPARPRSPTPLTT